ncbi:MAG: hypothetical protein GX436_00565 [Synergistaceae bacterium]|jgi:hypothetical protein|nr:hypothetical protein [Synergistaceae bacterium]
MLNEKLIFQAVKTSQSRPERNLLSTQQPQHQEGPFEHHRTIPWSWLAFRGPFEGYR